VEDNTKYPLIPLSAATRRIDSGAATSGQVRPGGNAGASAREIDALQTLYGVG